MKAFKSKIELFVETTENGTLAYSMIYPISATGNTSQELRDNALLAARQYFEIYGIGITWQNIQLRIDLHRHDNSEKFVNPRLLAEKAMKKMAIFS